MEHGVVERILSQKNSDSDIVTIRKFIYKIKMCKFK